MLCPQVDTTIPMGRNRRLGCGRPGLWGGGSGAFARASRGGPVHGVAVACSRLDRNRFVRTDAQRSRTKVRISIEKFMHANGCVLAPFDPLCVALKEFTPPGFCPAKGRVAADDGVAADGTDEGGGIVRRDRHFDPMWLTPVIEPYIHDSFPTRVLRNRGGRGGSWGRNEARWFAADSESDPPVAHLSRADASKILRIRRGLSRSPGRCLGLGAPRFRGVGTVLKKSCRVAGGVAREGSWSMCANLGGGSSGRA